VICGRTQGAGTPAVRVTVGRGRGRNAGVACGEGGRIVTVACRAAGPTVLVGVAAANGRVVAVGGAGA